MTVKQCCENILAIISVIGAAFVLFFLLAFTGLLLVDMYRHEFNHWQHIRIEVPK